MTEDQEIELAKIEESNIHTHNKLSLSALVEVIDNKDTVILSYARYHELMEYMLDKGISRQKYEVEFSKKHKLTSVRILTTS